MTTLKTTTHNNHRETLKSLSEHSVLTYFGIVFMVIAGVVWWYFNASGVKYNKTGTTTTPNKEKQNAIFDGDEEEENKFPVKDVRSTIDGKRHKVVAKVGKGKEAADYLARLNKNAQKVMNEIKKRLGSRSDSILSHDDKDITADMERLLDAHHNERIPLAEFYSPTSQTVGSNQGKGDLIEVCIRDREDPNTFNDENTAFRVLLHELAHSADKKFREDGEVSHGPHFKRLHKYLLSVASDLGLFSCEKYNAQNREFCGLILTEKYC